ncbi:MAG: hypothetical protein GY781_07610 [Gammaproteobacteria bacterium]|nr:hypothetical protein [Gammaproteobacteria bacterium]
MDRSLVSLISADGKLKGKYAVQDRNSNIVSDFNFTLSSTPLFKNVINKNICIWSLKAVHGAMAGELLAKFKVMLGSNDFLAGPLLVQGKAIGIYYADRQFSGQKITLKDLKAFQTVLDRANSILKHFGD